MISFYSRLAQLAAENPDHPALVVADENSELLVTRAVLLANVEREADALRAAGVTPGAFVVVALPNGAAHYTASIAAWALGACVLPLSPELPHSEFDALLELAQPAAVVRELGFDLEARPGTTRYPDFVACPGKAIGSGGSTGRPKVIVDPAPWGGTPGEIPEWLARAGLRDDQVQLVGGGLYHNTPFGWSHLGLFHGHTVVLQQKFDADRALELIEQYSVSFGALVPTMLARMAKATAFRTRDLTSIQSILHTASSCPAWVKRAWIERIGPERVVEGYGASDYIGSCVIRGDEWLLHPGSVGRGADCEIRILDDDGVDVPVGTVGHVYMRRHESSTPGYRYIGASPLPTTPDGFATVGDMGRLDDAGYLYLADRRTDLIITGGANVYPAEVEAVLSEHPLVFDCAVVGLPDDDWGQRVHAVVQLEENAGTGDPLPVLDAYCRERLGPAKRPKSFDFVSTLPRNGAGKIRRSALIPQKAQVDA